eukprot:COSAG02_NODE_34567_length_482_cov_0.671018_1_plen_44_part_01
MEICGVFHRYCAVNERTIILGEPSPVQLKMCVHMLVEITNRSRG